MAVLCFAMVIKCDYEGCERIALLKSDADWERFEKEWFEGLLDYFCPACKCKPEPKQIIAEEEKLFRPITDDEEDILYASHVS